MSSPGSQSLPSFTILLLVHKVLMNIATLYCHEIAVDPETGEALMVVRKLAAFFPTTQWHLYSYSVHDGVFGPRVLIPWVDYTHLEPAGNGCFHGLGVKMKTGIWPGTRAIYYLTYRNGIWSSPVELSSEIHSFKIIVFVADLNRRAFALWHNKKEKPVARWVEMMP
jgi:hypothetical protein